MLTVTLLLLLLLLLFVVVSYVCSFRYILVLWTVWMMADFSHYGSFTTCLL